MSKEYLEALKIGIPKLKEFFKKNAHKMSFNDNLGFDLTFAYLDKALQRLEAIDNAKPSEAFESLKKLGEEEIVVRDRDTIYMNPNDNNKGAFTHLTTVGVNFKGTIETIKQTLIKAKEDEEENERLWNDITTVDKQYTDLMLEYQEQEKVLEIIRKKRVNIGLVQRCLNCIEYNEYEVYLPLTLEEFDLLKKWLG